MLYIFLWCCFYLPLSLASSSVLRLGQQEHATVGFNYTSPTAIAEVCSPINTTGSKAYLSCWKDTILGGTHAFLFAFELHVGSHHKSHSTSQPTLGLSNLLFLVHVNIHYIKFSAFLLSSLLGHALIGRSRDFANTQKVYLFLKGPGQQPGRRHTFTVYSIKYWSPNPGNLHDSP